MRSTNDNHKKKENRIYIDGTKKNSITEIKTK